MYRLPCTHPDGRNALADAATERITLNAAQTKALLREAPAA
ncbi:hypothetical protein, partial [Paracidovorax anthurii]